MNKEIKFDHFKNIDELLEHIDTWYKEDDIDYTRWFHLEDLKKVKDYITNLQQENKQLRLALQECRKALEDEITIKNKAIEYIKSGMYKDIYDDSVVLAKPLLEILGDKENE